MIDMKKKLASTILKRKWAASAALVPESSESDTLTFRRFLVKSRNVLLSGTQKKVGLKTMWNENDGQKKRPGGLVIDGR